MGIYFGIAWGILMWFLLWSGQSMSVWVAMVASFAAGLLFGVSMAFYYRHSARKHSLSKWEDLSESADA